MLNGRSGVLVDENENLGYYKYSDQARIIYFHLIALGIAIGVWCLYDAFTLQKSVNFEEVIGYVMSFGLPLGLAKPIASSMDSNTFYHLYIVDGRITHILSSGERVKANEIG